MKFWVKFLKHFSLLDVYAQNDVEDEDAFSPDRKIFDLDELSKGGKPPAFEHKMTTIRNNDERQFQSLEI